MYPCIKFRLPFLCQLHAHTCPLYKILLEVVVVFLEINNCLHTFNMTMFVESQSFISLPSFMFVSALVSESKQNKEKTKKKNWLFPI